MRDKTNPANWRQNECSLLMLSFVPAMRQGERTFLDRTTCLEIVQKTLWQVWLQKINRRFSIHINLYS